MLKGRTRETAIRRDNSGRWFDGSNPLVHEKLVRAFDRWLERAPDGRYCLSNDINWAYVTIEGPPYFVRSIRETEQGFALFLSNEQWVPLEPQTLKQGVDGALYCEVLDAMVARFDRHTTIRLMDVIDEDEQGIYLKIGDTVVRPPIVEDPLVST